VAGILVGAENGYRFRDETVRAWFQERLAPEALRAAHGAAGAFAVREEREAGVLGGDDVEPAQRQFLRCGLTQGL